MHLSAQVYTVLGVGSGIEGQKQKGQISSPQGISMLSLSQGGLKCKKTQKAAVTSSFSTLCISQLTVCCTASNYTLLYPLHMAGCCCRTQVNYVSGTKEREIG